MVNWPAVIVAAITPTILGMTWYSLKMFGSVWMVEAKISPAAGEEGKKDMPKFVVLSLISGLIVSYILANLVLWLNVDSWAGVLGLTVMMWLAFFMPQALNRVMWERASKKLFWINGGYEFVNWLIVVAILTFWQ